MRTPAILVSMLGMVLLSGAARAEEIVYFKSGSAMPIVSHQVKDGMVHADLGANGQMAFPLAAVDRIEKAGSNVILDPSYVQGSNVRVPSPEGSYPVRGVERAPSDPVARALARAQQADPRLGEDDKGVAVYRPRGTSNAPNKRMLGAAGNRKVLTGVNETSEYDGVQRYGNRYVIGAPDMREQTAPTRMTLRPFEELIAPLVNENGATPQPQPPEPEATEAEPQGD
jgi:hypothetical protein